MSKSGYSYQAKSLPLGRRETFKFVGVYVYLNKIVRVVFPNVVNHLFDAFPNHDRVGGGALYLTNFSQLLFGKDSLLTVFKLILNRNRAESRSFLSFLTFLTYLCTASCWSQKIPCL